MSVAQIFGIDIKFTEDVIDEKVKHVKVLFGFTKSFLSGPLNF